MCSSDLNGTFRLGYGGGYFDRTLAAAAQRPFAIGVGFDVMRAPAFEPRPHDIAMDVIVTDEAITWRDAHEAKMLRR